MPVYYTLAKEKMLSKKYSPFLEAATVSEDQQTSSQFNS